MKPKHTKEFNFQVSARRFPKQLFWVLFWVEVGLVLADAIFNFGQVFSIPQLRKMVNIAREDSVANWLASVQMLFLGLTVLLLYWIYRSENPTRQENRYWAFFGLFFCYLGMDDGAKIHERIGPSVRELATTSSGLDSQSLGYFYEAVGGYSWHVSLLPIFALMGAWCLYFIWNEIKGKTSRHLLVGGICCWIAGVGLDYFEGGFRYTTGEYFFGMERYTVSHFQKSFEEFLEMLGTSLVWMAFIRHLFYKAHVIQFQFAPAMGATSSFGDAGRKTAPRRASTPAPRTVARRKKAKTKASKTKRKVRRRA